MFCCPRQLALEIYHAGKELATLMTSVAGSCANTETATPCFKYHLSTRSESDLMLRTRILEAWRACLSFAFAPAVTRQVLVLKALSSTAATLPFHASGWTKCIRPLPFVALLCLLKNSVALIHVRSVLFRKDPWAAYMSSALPAVFNMHRRLLPRLCYAYENRDEIKFDLHV
jgi:hypothetical protein